MKIATLGPKGTYAEQAAIIFANRMNASLDNEDIILTTVNHSLRLVQNREVDYAVIPVENKIDGLIGSSFDALIEYQDFVKVCDEVNLPISHVLAAKAGSDWKKLHTVYSHPSAINQCLNRLEEYFPGIALVPVLSTSEAAQKALLEETAAAICSRKTAIAHQMILFSEEIQDYANNETRFFVCSLTDGPVTQDDRTLLAVRYGMNQPGQLYDTAKFLADAQIDLTFIQSRPYKIRPQEYVLIYEFIGHKSSPSVDVALKNIEMQVRAFNGWKKILGSYPKRKREDEVEFA
ncbi:prephenate dehydratase/chorismate mutase/prephenate dehydratase [Hydrogenispora ethanolica]|uniref:Prephenate dehydratase n=1 Tax=Hydrogenispora ethanolica TaxID=1082276 RepID=A0A4R1R466_HYDET|nr:prephenate dehydratase domain-containing protein [Hydrogenispora ethanolica]TCL60255.1 prephenate dehydratase/chorismate mutase/prephenate dehydratase [Hydrogenispora ethanolica]